MKGLDWPCPCFAYRYTDCVCVPDLDYLVRLPDDFPLREEAVVILGGARMALSMVKRLKEVVMRNYSNWYSTVS